VSATQALVHHELCFGCGRTNLFGLLLEVEGLEGHSVAGRCFIKQDHQGADHASAHEGILAAALSEAMALACGKSARAASIEIRLLGPAAVGSFVELEARVVRRRAGELRASATASVEGRPVATAAGAYRAV
jgi:acyl-coenzyme A thioesterase PaaI-like protein